MGAVKETYEISISKREGFLNRECCKLLHCIRVRDFLERVTRKMRMMFDKNRTERFVRDRNAVTLGCITPA